MTRRVTFALFFVGYIFGTLSVIENSDIITFTSYSDIFHHIVAYLEPCVTLEYSEPCHILNTGISRTQDIFRTPSRHILAYSERCVTSAYWAPCHIQNFAIFRIQACLGPRAYLESCLFTQIQPYSDIFNNDSYNNIHFLFVLPCFQRNLKRHVFWLQRRQFQCSTEST